jgi:hypothetical protein
MHLSNFSFGEFESKTLGRCIYCPRPMPLETRLCRTHIPKKEVLRAREHKSMKERLDTHIVSAQMKRAAHKMDEKTLLPGYTHTS